MLSGVVHSSTRQFIPSFTSNPVDHTKYDRLSRGSPLQDAGASMPPQSSKRKKSTGTILEKNFKKGKSYSSVVCRLQTICHDSRLCEEIQRTALEMKQIQLEAWHLVNLHTLRCLESGLALPDFADKTFFDHCCSGVASTSKTNLIAQKNPDLWKSIVVYRSQRERAGLAEVEHKVGYGELKSEMREQMVVNAGVMIREPFRKRLRLYVQLRFGEIDNTMTKKQKAEKKNLVNAIIRACYNTEETELVEALEMRDVLTPNGSEWREQWIPWPNHIKENGMGFYVRLLWEFLDVVERRMETDPNEKGVRVFTLFPVSSTFSSAHITLNGSTLAGFYSRIPDHHFGLPHIPVTAASFRASRWEVMRHAFGITRFETMMEGSPLTKGEFAQLSVEEKYAHASRLFANQVTTDGYSASVLLFGPKRVSPDKSDDPVVPVGYVPNVVIGLDPGMRALVTAVREDVGTRVRPQRRKKRQCGRHGDKKRKRKKANRPRWIRRAKIPRQRNARDIVQVTTREYRHLAGFNRFRAWNDGLRKRHPQYQATIANMPSFKTACFATYVSRLEYFWQNVAFLLQFYSDRPFLKWKFFRKRMSRVAVDAIAKRIVPAAGKDVCVAYGDWSKRSGIKGHASSPVKGLKEALRKRATVVSMDEFRTSKLCSQCHQSLSPVRYAVDTKLPKRRKCKGVVLVRNRAEVQFEERVCHGVLRCDEGSCSALYWDRDVNAAINMVELLKSEILGLGRMESFVRA